jgi:hypothetical protein
MNRSYSKIRHIQESNRLLEKRVINEQIASNVGQLVKDIIGFIFDMNIIPGPIDGAKLLYDLYNEKDTVQTIKKFVRSRIPSPKENWKKIENDMDKLGSNVSDFKNQIYSELKSKIS